MNSIKGVKDAVQGMIDRGAATLFELHRGIANKPFDILESMLPSEIPVWRIRQVQERVLGCFYGTIRLINAAVGEFIDKIVAECEYRVSKHR